MIAKRNARVILGILAALLMLSQVVPIARGTAEASIWTDKQDYAPGDTVTIFGSGFKAVSTITLSVTRPDLVLDSWTTTSDAAGSFTTTYKLDGITGTGRNNWNI